MPTWANFFAKEALMTEAQFQTKLIRKIKTMFPGCVAMKNDAGHQQGIPDWTILYGKHWATLEVKASCTLGATAESSVLRRAAR